MNRDLTKGPVVRSMLLFAIPMILGDLLQQCYNIADTLIVGQFLGRNALAAVSLYADDLFDLGHSGALHGQRRTVFHAFRAAGRTLPAGKSLRIILLHRAYLRAFEPYRLCVP